MPSRTETDKAYQEAVNALKQINDELFYQELKTSLTSYTERVISSYEKTSSAMEEMTALVNRLPIFVEDNVRPQMDDWVKLTSEKMSALLNNFTQLQNNFARIQQELLNSIQEQKSTIQKLAAENQAILEREQQLMVNLFDRIDQQKLELTERIEQLNAKLLESEQLLGEELTKNIDEQKVELRRNFEELESNQTKQFYWIIGLVALLGLLNVLFMVFH